MILNNKLVVLNQLQPFIFHNALYAAAAPLATSAVLMAAAARRILCAVMAAAARLKTNATGYRG